MIPIHLVVYLLDNRLLCWKTVSQAFTSSETFCSTHSIPYTSVQIGYLSKDFNCRQYEEQKSSHIYDFHTVLSAFLFSLTDTTVGICRQVLHSMEAKQQSFTKKVNLQKVINNPSQLDNMDVFSSMAQPLGHLITFLHGLKTRKRRWTLTWPLYLHLLLLAMQAFKKQ